MRRMLLTATLLVGGLVAFTANAAGACGGLVGENGTIELVRTTTLAAYNDGIEHYITGFEFTGEGEEVGSIIPLPDEPTDVTKAGEWTLQRLVEEVAPPTRDSGGDEEVAADQASGAEVVLETEVEALDITVLRGGGDEVGEWATDNGFLLTPDAPEVLDFYAERSPYFMAAKFNAGRAADQGLEAGDSTPVMATIPTDRPWVPLRILGLGLDEGQQVEADVFMLTEHKPDLLAGGNGIEIVRSEFASDLLLDDLRSDERMDWVPEDAWLSYMVVNTSAGDLDYDLAASTTEGVAPTFEDAGIETASGAVPLAPTDRDDDETVLWPLVAAIGAGAAVVVAGVAHNQRMRRRDAGGGAAPPPTHWPNP